MIEYSTTIPQNSEEVYDFNPETQQSIRLRKNTWSRWSGLMNLSIGEVNVFPYSLENYVEVMEHLEHTEKIDKFTPDNIQLALLSIKSVMK